MPYRIEYSPSTVDHFSALSARQRLLVIDSVEKQLQHEPLKETRNRKPMRPNPLAPWELRIGNLRVYYDVEEEPEPKVLVRAVGLKERNRLRIGGKEFQL
jgi:mRNA-degrading endonuclease RelE of RelBE toxin-antitoxin system